MVVSYQAYNRGAGRQAARFAFDKSPTSSGR
jgi:hypothetical protein